MAIERVYRTFVGENASFDQRVRRYVDVYNVETSGPDVEAFDVRSASAGGVSIPTEGVSLHSRDPQAICRVVTPSRVGDSPTLWAVTAEYATAIIDGPPGGPGGHDDPNPIARPPKKRWGHIAVREPAQRLRFLGYRLVYNNGTYVDDVLEDPIDWAIQENSAWDAFDPPIEVERRISVLTITRNELNVDPDLIDSYTGAINSEPWFGKPKWTWKIASIDADWDYEGAVQFFRVTYQFHYNRDGWTINQLDAGYNELATAPGSFNAKMKRHIRLPDENNQLQKVNAPQKLNGHGEMIPLENVDDPEALGAVYLVYQEPNVRSFAPLAINQF